MSAHVGGHVPPCSLNCCPGKIIFLGEIIVFFSCRSRDFEPKGGHIKKKPTGEMVNHALKHAGGRGFHFNAMGQHAHASASRMARKA